MRNLKKFLALVLAMMMAFSLMISANAATTMDKTAQDIYPDGGNITEQFKEAVDVLYGMGVMTGDNGSFYGDRPVMRSEMAAVLYRLMTGDTTQLKNQLYAELASKRFNDVKETDWFAPYIGWCYDAGLMIGSNGYVRPWANVTGYETLVMVLRAMGYGKNHEYTGTGWNVNASSDGTLVGLLKDVNNSHYANTLAQNTRREVVASIVFQGAQLPTVVYQLGYYNPYVGIASGQGGNVLNPSLGKKNFGLTSHYGIVLGNEVTGEAKGITKIGFAVNPTIDTYLDSGTLGATLGTAKRLTNAEITDVIDLNAYYYLSDNDATNGTAENVTLAFKWKTDLYQFNHKVKVWYDDRGDGRTTQTVALGSSVGSGSVTFNSNNKTYALYDKVENVAVVKATTSALTFNDGDLGAEASKWMDSQAGVVNNWQAPGFDVGEKAYFNYAFGRLSADEYVVSAASATTRVGVSPIKANDSTADWPLYLLISNSADGTLDVVIPLELTFTKIVQRNTTTGRASTGVTNKNGGNAYFDTWDTSTGTDTTYTSIANANLKETPKTDLGTKVAAIAIAGTNGSHAPSNTIQNADVGYATKNAGLKTASGGLVGTATTTVSTFYYQLTENTQKLMNQTVLAVDYANQNVTLADGSILHQSVFAEATDGNFIPTAAAGATAANEACLVTGPTTTSLLQAGRSYNFTLDEQGHYIYWETAAVTAEFVYGTYIDFQTVPASSVFDYPLVYVKNGQAKQKDNIKGVDYNASGTVDPMDAALYVDSTTKLPLNKRDAADTVGNNSGYIKGKYIGYSLNSNGVLRAVTTTNKQGTGFQQAAVTDFGAGVTTIRPRDVVLGTAPLNGSNPGYYLTENTQFYLVDGAGMDNQTVTPFKGISALMEGMDSVVIDVTAGTSALTMAGEYLAANAQPYEMVYFQAGDFTYDQTYDPSALEVKVVYLPIDAVTFNKSLDSSLIFIGRNASTLVSSWGNHATKYSVVRNGVIEDVWMDGWSSEAGKASAIIETAGQTDTFYRMQDTGLKAADGEPIYTVRAVATSEPVASTFVIGKYFDGTWAAGAGTGTLTNSTGTTTVNGNFYATTFSQQVGYINTTATPANLRNVGNAKVLSLNSSYTVETVLQLCGASSLTDNIGVPVSCVLNREDTTWQTVSYIYINY